MRGDDMKSRNQFLTTEATVMWLQLSYPEGYADEMGSFVRDLSVSQVKLYKDLEDLNRERDQAHARAQDLLVELEKSKDQGTLNKNLIDQLRRELQTLKLPY